MRKMPIKLREKLANDPYYKKCVREDEDCDGRITWEHVFYFRSRQINERWCVIPICEAHHYDKVFDKRENERIALARATDEDFDNQDFQEKLKNI